MQDEGVNLRCYPSLFSPVLPASAPDVHLPPHTPITHWQVIRHLQDPQWKQDAASMAGRCVCVCERARDLCVCVWCGGVAVCVTVDCV